MTNERVYRPTERPDVEVLVDGVWRVGELRMSRQDDDGSWLGQVQYRPDEPTRVIATFPAELRPRQWAPAVVGERGQWATDERQAARFVKRAETGPSARRRRSPGDATGEDKLKPCSPS